MGDWGLGVLGCNLIRDNHVKVATCQNPEEQVQQGTTLSIQDVPVLYQLYSEYYSRIWQKERKLQESLESVKVGGGKEERRKEEEVSREEGISNVLGDTPKGQGEDDTILRIAQDVGRLNLTEFVKEYEEEQGKERMEERIVDQRKETQEMVEKLSMREAVEEVEESKCKSKTDSNKR